MGGGWVLTNLVLPVQGIHLQNEAVVFGGPIIIVKHVLGLHTIVVFFVYFSLFRLWSVKKVGKWLVQSVMCEVWAISWEIRKDRFERSKSLVWKIATFKRRTIWTLKGGEWGFLLLLLLLDMRETLSWRILGFKHSLVILTIIFCQETSFVWMGVIS